MKKIIAYIDGAARGNPGPAGSGAYLTDPDGNPVSEKTLFLGKATNNVAEYQGLLIALQEARRLGAEEVEIVGDSELLVRQMTGVYRVKNAGLKPLYQRALELTRHFNNVTFRHVPRAQNKAADALANEAIDAHKENIGKRP